MYTSICLTHFVVVKYILTMANIYLKNITNSNNHFYLYNIKKNVKEAIIIF